jgi:hypothetical protein
VSREPRDSGQRSDRGREDGMRTRASGKFKDRNYNERKRGND